MNRGEIGVSEIWVKSPFDSCCLIAEASKVKMRLDNHIKGNLLRSLE